MPERLAPAELAALIVDFLESRNGGELREAFEAQRTGDRRLMLDELALILEVGGRPANWVQR